MMALVCAHNVVDLNGLWRGWCGHLEQLLLMLSLKLHHMLMLMTGDQFSSLLLPQLLIFSSTCICFKSRQGFRPANTMWFG